MSQVQETKIEGSPTSIQAVGTYLRTTMSGASSTWAADVDSGREATVAAWSGAAADAFDARVQMTKKSVDSFSDRTDSVASDVDKLASGLSAAQQKMSDARATASEGGLRVVGTQIHGPGAAPKVSYETEEPYAQTQASTAAGAAYSKKVKAWNAAVDEASSGFEIWQDALDAFSSAWQKSGADLLGLTTDLLSTALETGALANLAYQLQGTKLINTDRLISAQKTLAQMTKDGKVIVPKAAYYSQIAEVNAARTAVNSADDMLTKGLRVSSKVSKGMWALGAIGTGYAIYDDMQNGESAAQATVSNVGGFAAGALTGVAAGAVIGTFILPPAGTIVGAAVGGLVGAAVGIFTSGVIDNLWEGAQDGVLGALGAGVDELADTGRAIGDLATGVWDAIF